MRVLQVNTVCGSGSTGRITVALHNALRDDGQECLVAYGRGRHLPSVDAIKVSNPLAISAWIRRGVGCAVMANAPVTRKNGTYDSHSIALNRSTRSASFPHR